MLHGPQRDIFDLSFELPSACAERLAAGSADIGIVPVAQLLRQKLAIFRGAGIASRGAVRTILLVSRVRYENIRTLAADAASRTSVLLARILLAQRYGVEPGVVAMPANLPAMLDRADAALIIGDPALRLEPRDLPFRSLDLGVEWNAWTGLPMVFAVWAGSKAVWSREREQVFVDSCRYGLAHLDDIVASEHAARGVTPDLALRYLRENVALELGEPEYAGLDLFLQHAAQLEPQVVG